MRRQSEFDRPRAYPGDADTRFRQWVLGLHQLLPAIPGDPRGCSCGSPAVLCPYLRAAHDLLGHPMPWGATPAPSAPPNRPDRPNPMDGWDPPGSRW
ncbi:MAG TPA: hypothetical protein VFX16_21325 [Pseudonocardiaceae bacterium]|nr:hypothetical protein [Pseudonocardiaceae bacterium]